jgi:hypothetical protein
MLMVEAWSTFRRVARAARFVEYARFPHAGHVTH